jgi:hypothetical protein
MTIFLALCAGLGLSAACGLRVFLPLFVAAVAVRAGGLSVGTQFDWLGSNASIVVFGTATAVEIVGFMIPWVDHVLDLLAAPLAAVAGSVLMCSQLLTLSVTSVDGSTVEPLLNPAVSWSLGIIVGAATASGVEAASIAGRLSSSVLTIGWLNPIYGMIETALSFIVTLGAIWIPIIVGGLVLLPPRLPERPPLFFPPRKQCHQRQIVRDFQHARHPCFTERVSSCENYLSRAGALPRHFAGESVRG